MLIAWRWCSAADSNLDLEGQSLDLLLLLGLRNRQVLAVRDDLDELEAVYQSRRETGEVQDDDAIRKHIREIESQYT